MASELSRGKRKSGFGFSMTSIEDLTMQKRREHAAIFQTRESSRKKRRAVA